MSQWRMNNCPNCGGDLFVDRDIWSNTWMETCILCGYKKEAEPFPCKTASSASQGVTAEKKKRMKKRRRPKGEGWLM